MFCALVATVFTFFVNASLNVVEPSTKHSYASKDKNLDLAVFLTGSHANPVPAFAPPTLHKFHAFLIITK